MSVEISTSAGVPERDRDRAIDKIERVIDKLEERVLHVDIRLTQEPDPARDRPAKARLSLSVNGAPVRVHVAAATMDEAIDLLDQRLRRRLTDLAEYRQAMRRRSATSEAEWRPADQIVDRSQFLDRPVEEREIVRQKSFTTAEASVDEAIFDLESMDYDFFLFTDSASGLDAVVWRKPEGRYGLRFANGDEPAPESVESVAAVEVDPNPVAVLSTAEARLALDATGDLWVFYRHPDHGRARILYRRYDGHYGMLTPAGE